MFRKIIIFFDKLEDRIRGKLSRMPILYALIGAVGIVLVWKGVWETAGYFSILNGPVSILLGALILLATGLLVSFFIGDNIIISGFRREKKLVERTEKDILSAEESEAKEILKKLNHLENDIHNFKKE